MIDHKILLSRLSSHFSIKGKILSWFESYLKDRRQTISVNGITSSTREVNSGVPQGSVLGSILYLLYMPPLGDIVRTHGLSYHFYADDSQLYIIFKPINEIVTISNIKGCMNDINNWMISNKLKLNKGELELLVIGSNSCCHPLVESITVTGEYINGSKTVRNLGSVLMKA